MATAPVTTDIAKIPSMTEMLQSLDKSPAPPTTDKEKYAHDSKKLPDEERWQMAWEWSMKGLTHSNIAQLFDVDERTIRRWILKAKQEFRKDFESETAADNLSGQLKRLESMEALCLYEASQLGKDGKEFDAVTGKVEEKKSTQQSIANKSKFMKLALECRRAQIDLLMQTGVIPREPGRMYHSLEEEGKLAEAEQDNQNLGPNAPTDRKQIIGDLLDKMERSQQV